MNHKKKNFIYPLAFLLVLSISFFYKFFLKGRVDIPFIGKNEITVVKSGDSEESAAAGAATEEDAGLSAEVTGDTTVSENAIVRVYICGAVVEPGVYEVISGSIVNDVLEISGGFTDDAAREYVNLVHVITCNESIYIPTYAEVEESGASRVGTMYIDGGVGSGSNSGEPDGGGEVSPDGRININTASENELTALPGIGEATARAIVEYRESHPFANTADIMNVSGIGSAKYERIREMICV